VGISYQHKRLLQITTGLYLVYITSFIFSFRAISSFSIGLLLLTGIIANYRNLFSVLKKHFGILLIISCVIFFLLQVISLLFSRSIGHEGSHVLRKSGIVILPLSICLTGYLDRGHFRKLLFYYCLILFAASLYCISIAGFTYLKTGDYSVFYYYALVKPLAQHAVYFSIYVFIALLILLESIKEKKLVVNKNISVFLFLFFSVFLFLLSSKFIIATYLIILIVYFILFLKIYHVRRSLIIGGFAVAITGGSSALIIHNPVSNRFYELLHGNLAVINQKKFTPNDYFNGVQFRLLQWEFVNEILAEKKAWWTGVGPVKAQQELNKKYISKNMYTGDPANYDHGHGLLGYNTHNEFLESLLMTGIPGLVSYFLVCFALIKIALKKKNLLLSLVTTLLILYSLIESILETQYGISLFLFFPLFLALTILPDQKENTDPSAEQFSSL
jgi:O-antigen ligase